MIDELHRGMGWVFVGLLGFALVALVYVHGCADDPPPSPDVVTEADSLTGAGAARADVAEGLVPDSLASARADSAYQAGAAEADRQLADARAETDRIGAALADALDALRRRQDDREPVRTPAEDVSADTLAAAVADLVRACDAERDACDRRDSLRLGRIAVLSGQRDSLRGAYDLTRRALDDMAAARGLLRVELSDQAARHARQRAALRTQRDVLAGAAVVTGAALAACLTVLDC